MCGISGLIDFSKKSSEQVLLEMTNTMVHRGPDGGAVSWIEMENYQLGFGHRRLAIIDLSVEANQPMRHQGLTIVYNGEIYNFQEIKDELIQLGHQFNLASDTEMILHAYQQWGANCLQKFIGMFAFVIYDEAKQELFMARDRAGVKPLFIYQNEELLLFASELKAFHKHPAFKKAINPSALGAFMQFGNVPQPHCIFENCRKLSPGHYLTIDLKTREEQLTKYWNVYDWYNTKPLDISFEEAKDRTKQLLTSACNLRMVADVPVGVFLSGGYDSSTVAAILQNERNTQLKTFTIGVPDIGLNEAPYAKDIAKHLNTEHTEFTCTTQEAFDIIQELPFFYDEPFGDSSAIPTTLVSRLARKEVTVALSADGGDEVFAGYNRYDYLEKYGGKLRKIPQILRTAVASSMDIIPSQSLPILRNKYNFHNRYEKLKNILRNPSADQIIESLSLQYSDKQLHKLLGGQEFNKLKTLYASNELLESYYSDLRCMQAVDYQTYLVDDILQKVDRATMAASLEGREPLLDHRIVEFAAQLPDRFKYKSGQKKFILKEIAHEFLPKELLNRPKMGFAIPIGKWMQNELKDLVETHINKASIEAHGLLDWQEVHSIKEAFYRGKREYELKMWYLLMFQMWYKRWM